MMLRTYFTFLIGFVCMIHAEIVPYESNTKVFVSPDNSSIISSGPHPVVPTAAVVEHKPGVPPQWTTRPPFYPTPVPENPGTNEEIIGQEPDRASFVEWLLGIVGIQQEKPEEVGPIPTNCAPCTCGLTYKHTRIVGGVETQVNEYVWMTILRYNDRFYCGASVINNKYLLTAAHCVTGFNKNRMSAVFLDHDRSDAYETKTFTRKISSIIKHSGYNFGGSYNNDIALLKLDQELPMNGILKPVCLPVIGKSFSGLDGIAVGWGATEEHGQVASRLQEVTVPIMSNIDCRKTGYGNKITDNMLCAGYKNGTKDSCQGDSGGPLHTVDSMKHHMIVGITSWGEGCARPNYPGVYTRVNRYISWIRSNTRDACYC